MISTAPAAWAELPGGGGFPSGPNISGKASRSHDRDPTDLRTAQGEPPPALACSHSGTTSWIGSGNGPFTTIKPVELRQLRYFCAVAEELSFARAARRLFIAQPALSIQIRNLESELKVQLLRRTTRLVEVTHAGGTFYAEARAILDRVDAAGQHAQDAERGVIGTLRVAFLSNVATARLGGLMRLYRERFPKVNLALMEAPTHRQIELLMRGDIDVGLLRISRERVERRPAARDNPRGGVRAGCGFPVGRTRHAGGGPPADDRRRAHRERAGAKKNASPGATSTTSR